MCCVLTCVSLATPPQDSPAIPGLIASAMLGVASVACDSRCFGFDVYTVLQTTDLEK